ncbi:Brix domain protein [Aphelenchoides besseyi]|nr:Brix domain protein [Aphelenchoides besseyi]KAI6216620.1 Brix domain protein [Aphelenchoides besseyi]
MLRREIRERREFIFRKTKEKQQRELQERREFVRDALDKNQSLPADLRKDAKRLAKESDWGAPVDNIDDEYRFAGCQDPKVVITTSRDPSASLKRFAKEIKLTIPNAQAVNRGSHDVKSIIKACKASDVTDVVFLNETRGTPDSVIVTHLPHGPTAYFSLHNVVMRHDVAGTEHMSEQYPHLCFHELNSKVGNRVTSVLKYLFPVPRPDSKRVVSFTNTDDFISFRQFTHKTGDGGAIELKELGPRFELRPYSIVLGTVDIANASETEWALRSYTNKKRSILSN